MKAPPTILLCLALLATPCLAKTRTARPSAAKQQSLEFGPYEKGGAFPNIYRDDFARTIREHPNGRFARAYRGERASLHRYFSRAQIVFEDADDSNAMSYVLLKLLLGCHDFRFSRMLEKEDYSTRQAVGRLLDPLTVKHHLRCPLTRSTYRYPRRQRPPARVETQRD